MAIETTAWEGYPRVFYLLELRMGGYPPLEGIEWSPIHGNGRVTSIPLAEIIDTILGICIDCFGCDPWVLEKPIDFINRFIR